jgi:uncharacterized protein (TIGR02145 family)
MNLNQIKLVLSFSMTFMVVDSCSVYVVDSCSVYNEKLLVDERDGKKYPVVKIGEQYWMGANLAYMPYVCPVKSDSGIYVYGNQSTNVSDAKKTLEYKTYGCLYNWAVAMNLPLEANSKFQQISDSTWQGICPEGWHIPTSDKFIKLEKSLETYPDFQKTDDRRNTGDVGKKLKSKSGWAEDGNGSNEYGFSALPSGIRYQDGYFTNIGQYGYFWTSSEVWYGSAYYRYMVYNSDGTYIGYPNKKIGMPVRCLKD